MVAGGKAGRMTVKAEGTKADAVSTDYLGFLGDIRKGQFAYECAVELEKVVKAVRAENKGGKLTVEIDIAPLTAGDASTLNVKAKAKGKAPEPAVPSAVFYSTAQNTLQRKDPRQMEMDV